MYHPPSSIPLHTIHYLFIFFSFSSSASPFLLSPRSRSPLKSLLRDRQCVADSGAKKIPCTKYLSISNSRKEAGALHYIQGSLRVIDGIPL
ncbi:hypothetical protein F4810DRAFT_674057 [Camillea tinctor]|nr:hypothetical protein F4810DRAFT_674057 [Camillea tinctor]